MAFSLLVYEDADEKEIVKEECIAVNDEVSDSDEYVYPEVIVIDEDEPEATKSVVNLACSVSGCCSNLRAPLVMTFPFPKEESRRKLWLKHILREDFEPTSSSAVCIHHFKEEFIWRERKCIAIDGSVIVVPREKPTLAPDAFPSLFIARPLAHKRRRSSSGTHNDNVLGVQEEYRVEEDADLHVQCIRNENENGFYENSVSFKTDCDEEVHFIILPPNDT